MSVPDLSDIWEQRLSAQAASGLNIATWCAEHDVNRRQFFYWRKKLRPEEYVGHQSIANHYEPAVRWISLEPCPDGAAVANHSIFVHIGTVRLELRPGFDRDLFREIVTTLGASL